MKTYTDYTIVVWSPRGVIINGDLVANGESTYRDLLASALDVAEAAHAVGGCVQIFEPDGREILRSYTGASEEDGSPVNGTGVFWRDKAPRPA